MAATPADGLLRTYPEEVQRLCEAARRAIRRWVPGVTEAVDAPARMLSYSHGPGYGGMVCTLLLSKTGIKLGIVEGASLPDPRGLLEGTGKRHRHVPLSTPEDLRRPGVKELVLAASAACRARLDGVPRKVKEVRTLPRS